MTDSISKPRDTGDLPATTGARAMDEPSQSPAQEGEPLDTDSLVFLDEEDQPGPSGVPRKAHSLALSVPTTTTTNTRTPTTAALPSQTPEAMTCVAATSTITTTASNTVPLLAVANTTRQTGDAGDNEWWQLLAPPQVRDSRAGGRPTGGQPQEDCETAALDTMLTVLGVYQQNQGQMGQVLGVLRELCRLQSSMDTHLGQHVEYMGQFVGVLRDMNAAPPPRTSRMIVTPAQQRPQGAVSHTTANRQTPLSMQQVPPQPNSGGGI